MSLDSGLGTTTPRPINTTVGAPSVAPTSTTLGSASPYSSFANQASSAFNRVGSAATTGYNYLDTRTRNLVAQANNRTQQAYQDSRSAFTNLTNRVGGYDRYLTTLSSGTSAFSKILFLIAVVIGFLVLVSIGTKIITESTTFSKKPYLLNNLKSGTEQKIIPQDPRTAHSIPLLRSNDQQPGIEFTYSTWLFIDELPKLSGDSTDPIYKHVFHQGSPDKFTKQGMSQPINTPGLYITTNANKDSSSHLQDVGLTVVMSTFEDPEEKMTIENIPIEKWINVVIVLKNRVLDVYINGTIAGRHILKGVPMQSYGPLNMSLNGGFTGKMSTTQYFAYALSPVQIADIATSNPSLKEADGGIANPFPPYLSLRWYTGSGAI